MTIIVGKDVEIYSFPLGSVHKSGYDELVKRVCQVTGKHETWTGFLVVDTVLTSSAFTDSKQFDIEWYGGQKTSGFLAEDMGELLELHVGFKPEVDLISAQFKCTEIGERLFIIGNFYGQPFSLASCTVDKVMKCSYVLDEERRALIEQHSVGSPVFNKNGSLVGIVDAFVNKTDKIIMRSLIANGQGKLIG